MSVQKRGERSRGNVHGSGCIQVITTVYNVEKGGNECSLILNKLKRYFINTNFQTMYKYMNMF